MGYLGRSPTPSPIDSSDIPANSIDASKIIDGAIAVADVADNAITEAKIADAAVVSLKSGRKNLIINGGFDVWQRGTSLAGASKYLADRWFNTTSGTQSRQTFTVGQTDVPHNPTYYYRQVTGSSEWYETRQKIENVALTSGREVTLSYWMKGSSAFTNAPYRVQNFGSGGSSEVSAALTTASVTTSWAKYTQTFTLPSVSGKTIGDGSYLQIHILRANLDSVTVDIANVQLEVGSVATDFEHRSYGEELALCQRYYQKATTGTDTESVGSGTPYQTGSGLYVPWRFLIEMRVAPTLLSSTGVSDFRARNGNSVTFAGFVGSNGPLTRKGGTLITATVAGSTIGDMHWIETNVDAASLAFDAEL